MITALTYEEELADQTERYRSMFATGSGKAFTGDDAVRWCEVMLKRTYWSFQKKFIKAVFDNRHVVARSCNDIGKTLICADIAICFLFNLSPSKVITLAPTFPQVRDALWAEIRKDFDTIKESQDVDGVGGMNGIECNQTRLELGPGWFATGVSPDKGVNLQGYHQANVLVIIDEAPGVRPEIMSAAHKLMAGGNVHMVWIGNPLQNSGAFFNACRGGGSWIDFHISYEDTPNFVHLQENPDPDDVNLPDWIKRELISEAWVEERRDEDGEDSPLFYSE